MSRDRIYVEGELYLSLETVADVYQVQITWLREAYDSGLFGTGVEKGPTVCIAAVQLDRVATIVRLHETLGLDLETIHLTLESARA